MSVTNSSLHKEIMLEEHLVQNLCFNHGYEERAPSDFDRKLALDTGVLIEFIKETQPEEWDKLTAQYAVSAETELLKQLEKALKARGTLDVLRHGLKLIPNIQLRFCFFQPASSLNKELVALYESNRLTVIRQLKYSQKNENAIDVGLFINGIPVATLELKNLLTGSTFKHAERQYIKDRSPAGETVADLQAWCTRTFRSG